MMGTALLVAFLVAHGLIHLAIWLPQPRPDAEKPPPFVPDHSVLLTAARVRPPTAHGVAAGLAVATASAYIAAGFGVAGGAAWTAGFAALAAGLALALKLVFFHPWLSLGLLLDLAVLSSALLGWPVTL